MTLIYPLRALRDTLPQNNPVGSTGLLRGRGAALRRRKFGQEAAQMDPSVAPPTPFLSGASGVSVYVTPTGEET